MSSTDLRFYLSLLLKRLPLILATAALVFAVAIAAALMMPKLYRASAKMLVETAQIPTELARSSVAIGALEQLQVLQQQISTRENLVALAERLNVYATHTPKPSADDIMEDMRARISFDQMAVDASGRDLSAAIFNVSFVADNPVMAADVANEVTSMLVARNQRQREERAGNTLAFFDREVRRLGAELAKVEGDILKFKTENKDTLPDSVEFRRSQQSSLQERFAALEREESDLRSRRSGLIATYSNTGQLSDATPLSPEQQMLAELNRALTEQLAVFSEESPNVGALRKRIVALQSKLLARPAADTSKKDDHNDSAAATASFGLDLQLSDIDDRLQAIARERTSTTKRIEDLTQSISATPASATALNVLERNRENVQTQYNAAIARRAEALTGEQIEMRADGGRMTLIEAASPPADPIRSKRRPLVAAGGLAGLALGIAVAGLLELLKGTVRRPADIVRLLQVQPLATIPVIENFPEAKATNRKRTIAVAASAAGVPACLLVIYYCYMFAQPVIDRIASGFGLFGAV